MDDRSIKRAYAHDMNAVDRVDGAEVDGKEDLAVGIVQEFSGHRGQLSGVSDGRCTVVGIFLFDEFDTHDADTLKWPSL